MNASTNINRTPLSRRKRRGLGLPLAIVAALVLAVAGLFLALSAMPTNAQEATPTYTVTDSGIPLFNPEGDSGGVIAFNEVGQVVGYSSEILSYDEWGDPILVDTAWLWSDDGDPATNNFKDLGHVGAGQRSTHPSAINDHGHVVGSESDPSGAQGDKAWLWRDDGSADTPDMQDLTPEGYQHGYAADINNEDQVAVGAFTYDPDLNISGDVFLWQEGSLTKLPALPGAAEHWASGINNLGQIVGSAMQRQEDPAEPGIFYTTEKPILWENSTVTELPTLPGTLRSHATDINDQGLVVGTAYSEENGEYTWIYNVNDLNDPNATVTVLPAPPGAVSGPNTWMYPSAINNSGQIVGYADSESSGNKSSGNIPWLYSGGEMYDIQALIPASKSKWTVTDAIDINDQGQILGYAFDSRGNYPTVLLSPTDVAPTVTSVVPEDGATKVSRDIIVTAAFSEEMDRTSVEKPGTVTLYKKGTTTPIAAAVSYDETANKATLDPSATLKAGTAYQAVVSTEAKDLAGNPLDQSPLADGNQPMKWTFKTGS